MTTEQDHEQEARELLASRIADMRSYLSLAGEGYDVYDDSEVGQRTEDELYSIGDYGLEWSKHTTNHREGTVTYVHVLSTGGPHDEFQVTFDPDKGQVMRWVYVYLPWFDRVELSSDDGWLDNGEDVVETIAEFYDTFYGELVQMDADAFDSGDAGVYDR